MKDIVPAMCFNGGRHPGGRRWVLGTLLHIFFDVDGFMSLTHRRSCPFSAPWEVIE